MAHEVEFHTGVADPQAFACRLLRKAVRAGARVLCTAPPDGLDALDRALWTFEERDFVPHVRVPGAAERVSQRTPIWLVADADAALARHPAAAGRVLVNLGGEMPADPRAFARVIEVVGADPYSVEGGRRRWRHYKAAGCEIRHHAPLRERP